MYRSGSMMKGIGIGMAIGGAAAMVGSALMSPKAKRRTKRNAEKMMKSMSEFVDSVQTMVK